MDINLLRCHYWKIQSSHLNQSRVFDLWIFVLRYISKISLLTKLANVSGVFNTLQTKVSFEIAIVFATFTLHIWIYSVQWNSKGGVFLKAICAHEKCLKTLLKKFTIAQINWEEKIKMPTETGLHNQCPEHPKVTVIYQKL